MWILGLIGVMVCVMAFARLIWALFDFYYERRKDKEKHIEFMRTVKPVPLHKQDSPFLVIPPKYFENEKEKIEKFIKTAKPVVINLSELIGKDCFYCFKDGNRFKSLIMEMVDIYPRIDISFRFCSDVKSNFLFTGLCAPFLDGRVRFIDTKPEQQEIIDEMIELFKRKIEQCK